MLTRIIDPDIAYLVSYGLTALEVMVLIGGCLLGMKTVMRA